MSTFIKYLILLAVIVCTVTWLSTEGIERWNLSKINKAIRLYYKKNDTYPRDLTAVFKTREYIDEEPVLPKEGSWYYNPNEGKATRYVFKKDERGRYLPAKRKEKRFIYKYDYVWRRLEAKNIPARKK